MATTDSPLNSPEDPPPGARPVWPPAPQETAFVDVEGIRWRVTAITRSDSFQDFYLVHLRFTTTSGIEGSEVFGPREFAALAHERGLRPE